MNRRRPEQGPRPDSAGNSVAFSVSPLLFEITGSLLESPGLTMGMIERLSTKRPTATYITFAEWKSFAKDTAGLPEATITSLFDAFHTLSSKTENRVENSRLLLGKMGGTLEESRYRTASSTRVVSLPGFSLFLMVQTFLESQKGGDNPSEILNFVKQNLSTMVATVGITRPGHVTPKDISELGLLLREFDKNVEHPFGTSLQFLWRDERVIDANVVAQYIRTKILPQSDIKGVVGNIIVTGSNSAMQILTAPLGPFPIKHPGFTFKIQAAAQTTFYVTSVLPSTVLTGLNNCSVHLGPVSGVLHVHNCESCTISAMCGAIILSECKNVTVYVCTNTPPILATWQGKLEGVFVAPYNTFYSTLEEHIAVAGISPKLNLWKIGVPNGGDTSILPPSKFVSSSFPVAPLVTPVMVTRTNPCPLPKEYQDALAQKLSAFNATSTMLESAYKQLEAANRKDLADNLRSKVHHMFLDWAYSRGQLKGLVDLLQNNVHATE